MKKMLYFFIAVALLATTFTVAALNTNASQIEALSLSNATFVAGEKGDYYMAEDYCIITLTADCQQVFIQYYDLTTEAFAGIDPLFTDAYDNTLVDVVGSVCLGATGQVMDFYDWYTAYLDGETTDEDLPYLTAGTTLMVHGNYYMVFTPFIDGEETTQYHIVVDNTDDINTYPSYLRNNGLSVPSIKTVIPTTDTVFVDGNQIILDAYQIDDGNYVKLRDIAAAINGTSKQFAVEWNQDNQAITLISGIAYTPIGGELTAGDGSYHVYTPSTSTLSIDGHTVEQPSYLIDDNHYFKLSDMGEIFDFDVTWDDENNTITLDTISGYTPN